MFYLNDIFLLRPIAEWKSLKYDGLVFSARILKRSSSSLQTPEVSVIAYLFTKSSAGVGAYNTLLE